MQKKVKKLDLKKIKSEIEELKKIRRKIASLKTDIVNNVGEANV